MYESDSGESRDRAKCISRSLLRQAIGPRQCVAGLEQALEARQDLRPASRHGIDEFICALLLGLMGDRTLHHTALRFDLDRAACIAFRLEIGHELVAPFDDDALERIDVEDLAGVGDATIGEDDLPGRALLPVSFLMGAEPILPVELR